MQNVSILGTRTEKVHLDHIDGVETRKVPTYAYNAHAGNAHDTYHTLHQDNFYLTVVLHCKGKVEHNLVPNAAYFFLHPFAGVTREVDNTLAQTVAKFLNVPLKIAK